MHDSFAVRGRLRVFAINDDIVSSDPTVSGRLLLDQHNLVVNQGLSALSRLLGGGAGTPLVSGVAFSSLDEIAVKTMELGSAAVPPPPQATDVGGVGSLVYTPSLVVTYPDAYTVRFQGVLPLLELVGTTITEECLRLANNLVFAKVKLVTPVLKTNTTALAFLHDVSIERV